MIPSNTTEITDLTKEYKRDLISDKMKSEYVFAKNLDYLTDFTPQSITEDKIYDSVFVHSNEILSRFFLGDYEGFREQCKKAREDSSLRPLIIRVLPRPFDDPEMPAFFEEVPANVEILNLGIDLKDDPSSADQLLDNASGVRGARYALEDTNEWFEQSFQKVDSALFEEREVFVHCQQGISRSATFVWAYVASRMHLSADIALNYVQTRRPCVNPNEGFRALVQEYCRHKKKDYSMIVSSCSTAPRAEDSSLIAARWDAFKMHAFDRQIIILDIKDGVRPELKLEEIQKLFRFKLGLLGPHFSKEPVDTSKNPERIYRCFCTKADPTGDELREALAAFFEESKDHLRILNHIKTKELAPEGLLSDWGIIGDESRTIFVHKFGTGK